jgi:adenylate cyclase
MTHSDQKVFDQVNSLAAPRYFHVRLAAAARHLLGSHRSHYTSCTSKLDLWTCILAQVLFAPKSRMSVR